MVSFARAAAAVHFAIVLALVPGAPALAEQPPMAIEAEASQGVYALPAPDLNRVQVRYGEVKLDEDQFVAVLEKSGTAGWLVQAVKARKAGRMWSGVAFGTGAVMSATAFTILLESTPVDLAPGTRLPLLGSGLGVAGAGLGLGAILYAGGLIALVVYGVPKDSPSFYDLTRDEAKRAVEEYNQRHVQP